MKQIQIKLNNQNYELVLPNSPDEITNEFLKTVTDGFVIGDNRSLVAIITQISLGEAISGTGKKKETVVGVIPRFIKSGKTDVDYIKNIKLGDYLVIGAGDLENGYHVNFPSNSLMREKVIYQIVNDENTNNGGMVSKARQDNMVSREKVCFVSFKIVDNYSIAGIHPDEYPKYENNPYFVKKSILN